MSTATVQTSLGHVGLNVSRIDRSLAFYTDLLPFEVVAQSDPASDQRWAFLGQDGAVQLTLWEQSQGRFATDRPGLHHLAFEVADLATVEAAEARLRAQDVRIYHDGVVAHREGAASGGLFFEDPDGTRIEIFTAAGAGDAPAPAHDGPACGFF